MGPSIVLPVYGLALVDTLSPATIGITTYVLLTTRRRTVRLLVAYAATVALFYFALGAGLVVGLDVAITALSGEVPAHVTAWGQVGLGVAMFIGSWFIPTKKDTATSEDGDSEASRMRSVPGMIGLGLTTGLVEAGSALPYLAAVGIVTAADLGPAHWMPLLAGYNLIMVAPVAVLFAAWRIFGERIRPRLDRIRNWLNANTRETLSWIVGIVGFLIAASGLERLAELGILPT